MSSADVVGFAGLQRELRRPANSNASRCMYPLTRRGVAGIREALVW